MEPFPTNRFRRGIRTLGFLAAVLAAVLLLHLLPALIFAPVRQTKEKEQIDRRFTVMLKNEPSLQYDPYDLHYWLKYGDPMLFAKTDGEFGFSAALKRNLLPEDEVKIPLQTLSLTESVAAPRNNYQSVLRLPDQLLEQLRTPMPLPRSKNENRIKNVQSPYPRWTTSSGIDLGNIFPQKESLIRRISRSKPKKPTVLLYLKGVSPEMPPNIRVRQSCGDHDLDLLAVETLSSYAGQNLKSESLKKLNYVIVDWKTGKGNEKK